MEPVKLTAETISTFQYLADNGILSKTSPTKFHREIVRGEIVVTYETSKYKCNFLTVTSASSSNENQKIRRSPADTLTFANANSLYTPFLYPILGLVKEPSPVSAPSARRKKTLKSFVPASPVFSYGVERKILDEIFTKAKYLLRRAGLPETDLPQFLALSSSAIYEKKNGYNALLSIQNKARFTTVQILQYLKNTNDVEEIINMWHTGVMPSDYNVFKESFADAPEEWISEIFSENVKNYWPETIIK